ncbi:MAG: B12-binding domain-containing radical SAM protein [bacterium]
MSKRVFRDRRRLLQDEYGTIDKKGNGFCKLRIALAYPNSYHVGMSNLGFQLLYRLFNQAEGTLCQRVFLPENKEYCFNSRRNILTSFESEIPVREFDILAFSVNYELDYFNVVKMLQMAGLPLLVSERAEGPIIMAGGACVTMNPEPLADFLDLFVLGDGEPACASIINEYLDTPPLSRTERLARLGSLPGNYRPPAVSSPSVQLPDRLICRRPEGVFSQIVTPNTEFSDIFLLEISRGCKQKCPFCLVGGIYSPYRPYRFESLEPFLRQGISLGKKIGLVAANVADHPEIERIMRFILSAGGSFTISSLKIGQPGIKLLPLLRRAGCRTVSIAPESASQKLLDRLKKGLRIPQIYEMAEAVYANSLPNIKLYFLLGIPGETGEDFQALIRMIHRIDRIRSGHTKNGKITVSINPLTPKPHTAFAHIGVPDYKKYHNRITALRKEFRQHRQIRIIAEKSPKGWCQFLLSTGDRRLATLFQLVVQEGYGLKQALTEFNPVINLADICQTPENESGQRPYKIC